VSAIACSAAVLAAFALALVTFAHPRDAEHDLQLIVAEAAPAGELLPMRALLYTGLRALDGPRLLAHEVHVRLRDSGGRTLSETRLRPSRTGRSDLEGALRVPEAARGRLTIAAETAVEGERLALTAPLAIAERPGLVPEGRALRVLQQFSAGPIQPEPGASDAAAAGGGPPDRLEARVAGGACVPEEQCGLFVHVGEPAAAIWVEGNSTLTPSVASARPSGETGGIVELSVVTHGPEAQLWLRVERAGRPVARRSVRLPVALGAVRLRASALRFQAPASPRLGVFGGEGGCIVDAFRDEAWVRSGSSPRCTPEIDAPFATLSSGTYRLQARRDPFSADSAGVALVRVLAPDETAEATLRELATRVAALEPRDAFAREVLAGRMPDSDGAEAAALGYLAAALESGVIAQPRARSDYSGERARLSAERKKLRVLSIAALALGALALALAVGQSGLRASGRADLLLMAAGQPELSRRRARMRAGWTVALSVLSLVLVFVVIGAYVLARSAG
jgi:hypothetical protein